MPVLMTARLPRIALVALLALAATAGITLAAGSVGGTSSPTTGSAPLVQKRATLVVPDVRRQAFVFAKGALQDAGFAWRVVGGVRGYAANTVVSETPAPGTRVKDTGAPLVKLTLSRNSKYGQDGAPEDVSPYRATRVVVADALGAALAPLPAPTPAATTAAAPATTTAAPAATTTAGTTTASYPEHAPAAVAKHVASAKPAKAAKPAAPARAATPAAPAKQHRYPQSRPAAFAAAGAPAEPLDEMPLPDRARLLGRWLAEHRQPTSANVRHWLYQNEWIVTGARFGWWRGAEALRLLIAVDRRTVAAWGIGAKSTAAAEQTLAAVEAKSR
jgi:hypothetical protein